MRAARQEDGEQGSMEALQSTGRDSLQEGNSPQEEEASSSRCSCCCSSSQSFLPSRERKSWGSRASWKMTAGHLSLSRSHRTPVQFAWRFIRPLGATKDEDRAAIARAVFHGSLPEGYRPQGAKWVGWRNPDKIRRAEEMSRLFASMPRRQSRRPSAR